ncbi:MULTISPECIES: DUF2147 domain-containing protein [Azorhizobium]|uniref:DUF2147 domain-containing protein n=1 Tax=Azorhizobium caulinodans (strain ATCC 43989 / DSM 5975 / JCM 20966 / LMG 6465 / NBRC 14845 / NCIMB 13405 / ORS 571) TaxID=438753 RepID=A8I3T2_AZOC5|nr:MULTISPECIES: DUF2147 domain-containing protein [Azorhizobium]TDT94663.1 uncharacterized protein (DUF2147 family) [Azorhizobium sp. AG788]BAF87649.1 uncharacterized protein AZC_1651 [Azorhizobium caulinodans ORS 571]
MRGLSPLLAALATLPFLATASLAASPDAAGVWLTDDGEAAVEFKACPEGLCGTIVWLKTPLDEGQPAQDDNNPDASLRSRPLCGLPIVGGLRRNGDRLDGGWIYDPESGRRYQLVIRQHEREALDVTAYMGVEALGQTVAWHRAPAGQERCAPPAKAGR